MSAVNQQQRKDARNQYFKTVQDASGYYVRVDGVVWKRFLTFDAVPKGTPRTVDEVVAKAKASGGEGKLEQKKRGRLRKNSR